MPAQSGSPALLPVRRDPAAHTQQAPARNGQARGATADFGAYFASASVDVSERMLTSPLGARTQRSSLVGGLGAGLGQGVLAAGAKYLGIPYEMGAGRQAGTPTRIDCSAFVAKAYADATGGRVKLTAYTDAMYDQTAPVDSRGPQPGDLVFYSGYDSDQPNTRFPHVAIYAGNGRVLDASSIAGKVAYRPVSIGAGYRAEYRRVAV